MEEGLPVSAAPIEARETAHASWTAHERPKLTVVLAYETGRGTPGA